MQLLQTCQSAPHCSTSPDSPDAEASYGSAPFVHHESQEDNTARTGAHQLALTLSKQVASGIVVGALLAWAALPEVEGVGKQSKGQSEAASLGSTVLHVPCCSCRLLPECHAGLV